VIAALGRPALARLLGTRRAWISVGAWIVLGFGVALAARAKDAAHAADHVLIGAYGALILPLLAYAVVGAALGARSLDGAVAPLVSFGAAPRNAAAITLAIAIGASAVCCAVVASAVALIAHGKSDPPIVSDAFSSAYAGALGGAAYAAWFGLGATFGRRGGGRAALLAADWLLDGAGAVLAVATPRAHVRNLLGGTPPIDLSERASAVALIVLTLAYTLAATYRARQERISGRMY
jgi:hypothetical protein